MQKKLGQVRQRLRAHHQEQVLTWWPELTVSERRGLEAQLQSIDLGELGRLFQQRGQKNSLPAARIAPLPRPKKRKKADRALAEEAFRSGAAAFLVVAGGQGTRLHFDHPKGMFPVGPVTGKSLFQIHAEKIVALRRRYQAPLPFLVMTSHATHDETLAYFQEKNHFGLAAEDVWFFQQGTMPAMDWETGRLLLESKGRLFLSPNGHGGTLTGLADSGLLERLRRRGVRTVHYFQVDNPLVDLADGYFLGSHLAARAQVSSKVVPKAHPLEKVGTFVLLDGRCAMIEYSDLPEDLAKQTDAQGRPRLWAGNPAIHLFDVDFLAQVTAAADRIPWHLAKKKVPYLDCQGRRVEPAQENALKFERFIFDVLPQAQRWTIQATRREDEFEPLKNATGADSPLTVRRAISQQAARWLEQAGATVSHDDSRPLEISPLFALDVAELAARITPGACITGPKYLA